MPSSDNLQPTERTRTETQISYVLLAASLLWSIYWFVHAWHYWEDDAWIHLEFARSVASGQGFAFNGRVVAGDTAPLWVFLLDAAHAFISNWIVAGKVLAVLGAIFSFAGIYAFARRLSAGLPLSRTLFPAAIILLIAVNPYTCYWIFSGMEAVAAAGFACFAVLAATRERPTNSSFLIGCLMAGLGPLLRPEMIFLAALLVVPLWGQYKRLRSPNLSLGLAGLVLLVAPLALWSVYCLHAFGHLLPNTNAAKRAPADDSVLARLANIYSVGFPIIICGVVCGVITAVRKTSAVRRSIRDSVVDALRPAVEGMRNPPQAFPLAGWIFVAWFLVATVFYIGNHTYVQTRYIFVSAPGLTVLVLVQLSRLSKSASRGLYVLGLLSAIGVSLLIVRPFIRNKGINCDEMTAFALYLRDRLPPNDPVAVYAIGQIAFVSQHPIVDTGGITQPDLLSYLKKNPDGRLQWAIDRGAKYYIDSYSSDPDAKLVYASRLHYIGWTLHSSQYESTEPFAMWKLPTTAAGPASPAAPAGTTDPLR